MKFLADENFPITAYKILLATGYDSRHVTFEMLTSYPVTSSVLFYLR